MNHLHKFFYFSTLIFLVCLAPSCQTAPARVSKQEKEEVERAIMRRKLENYFDRTAQAASVGYRLLQKKVPQARDGKIVKELPLIFTAMDSGYQNKYGIIPRDGLVVAQILNGFGIEDSGIQRYDVLLSVDGIPVPDEKKLQEMLKSEEKDTVTAVFERSGQSYEVKMPVISLERKITFLMDESLPGPNAYVDLQWDTVHITPQLLRFVNNEDELACILAHEMAHMELHHVGKGMVNNIAAVFAAQTVGALVNQYAPGAGYIAGNLTGMAVRAPYSQHNEKEADYHGLKRMMNAGFDPYRGSKIWERFAIELPQTMEKNILSTHPSSPERLLRVQESIKEILAGASIELEEKNSMYESDSEKVSDSL